MYSFVVLNMYTLNCLLLSTGTKILNKSPQDAAFTLISSFNQTNIPSDGHSHTTTHTESHKSNRLLHMKYQKLRPLTNKLELNFNTHTHTQPLPRLLDKHGCSHLLSCKILCLIIQDLLLSSAPCLALWLSSPCGKPYWDTSSLPPILSVCLSLSVLCHFNLSPFFCPPFSLCPLCPCLPS